MRERHDQQPWLARPKKELNITRQQFDTASLAAGAHRHQSEYKLFGFFLLYQSIYVSLSLCQRLPLSTLSGYLVIFQCRMIAFTTTTWRWKRRPSNERNSAHSPPLFSLASARLNSSAIRKSHTLALKHINHDGAENNFRETSIKSTSNWSNRLAFRFHSDITNFCFVYWAGVRSIHPIGSKYQTSSGS